MQYVHIFMKHVRVVCAMCLRLWVTTEIPKNFIFTKNIG